jgi:hypothetical protein
MMSNVIAYPSSNTRIDLAIDRIFSSIRCANLEQRIARLSEGEWGDLITDAVASELRAPSSGFGVVLKMLRRVA